ncbi:MAG: tRNA (guanosine(37)-N1)-methyltransferase TrmD [Clostridia bacterium]|nr:tRNA (guanosine(37)-N1)-methyltransferase TrmD [Clostridia bacterium]
MKFDILTLFPELFRQVLSESIIGRAQENGLIQINPVNIRDFSKDKHRKVDDYPYGGGSGMVMMSQPIYDAYLSLTENLDYKPKLIYMSPQGRLLDQKLVEELKNEEHLILLCGHYEGIDERIIEDIVDMEVSIGDYVLTGGELPAMVLIDSVSRLVPGVLSGEESYSEESHYNGLLEYPQYTRPFEFNRKKVPDILVSGHHANIQKWRRQQSIKRTYFKRPDMIEGNKELEAELKKVLESEKL